MMGLYPAVMSAIDPRLQIGKDKMDHRQMLLRLVGITPERERIMSVANLAKAVSLPAVSANDGACRYVVLDECGKRIGVATRKRSIRQFGAGNDAEPETPGISEFLDRDAAFVGVPPFHGAILSVLAGPHLDSADHRCLMMDAPAFPARATANIAFVYLDGMRRADCVAVWPHHTGAEFVKHCKRRLVSGDPKLPLKLDGRLTGRLRRHEVGAPKPSREGHVARLHDRPGSERRIFFTGTAAQYNRRTGCKPIRLADDPAILTGKAAGPADRLQITGASAVIRENALKLGKARWEG